MSSRGGESADGSATRPGHGPPSGPADGPPTHLQRPRLGYVEGIPMAEVFFQDWEEKSAFRAQPEDIVISTYPKSGTTWLQEIVDAILGRGDVERCKRAPTDKRVPFLEMSAVPDFRILSGIDQIEQLPSPRVIKTHLPYQLVPKSFWDNNSKVIYLARNAKDVMVSCFYFAKMNFGQPDPGTWDEYFRTHLDGAVPWGCWWDHVLGYWDKREHHRILYLLYEDMKEDPRAAVEQVAEFLDVRLPEEALEKIVHHTSFEQMRDNPMANYTSLPSCVMDHSVSPFMRKGSVGDWRNHFTVAQNEEFDEVYAKRMAGTSLSFRHDLPQGLAGRAAVDS
ncbi:sulfotransferase 1B1-like isoform X1 [Lampetra fluviatilis]